MALGLVWLAGAVALQAPQARGLRDDIQRSSILRALNDVLPPSGPILNALARFDPFPRIDGPPVDLPAPRRGDRPRPRGARGGRAAWSRSRGPPAGWASRARAGSPRDGLVVTNAHVVAGQDDTTVQLGGGGAQRWPRTRSSSTRTTTSPSCASTASAGARCAIASDPRSGASGAILGFPQNGPYDVRAGAPGRPRAR